MALNHLVENQQLVQALWHTVNTGAGNLEVVGPLVRRVLDTRAWEEREVVGIGVVKFKRLADFIVAKPLAGCGWEFNKVTALIRDDLKLLGDWQEAMVGKPGHPIVPITDVISIKPQHGTSRADTIRRLKKDRPDLHARVVDGEISAHAAAIEAGFRKKPTPLETILKLVPKLTDEEWQQVVKARCL